MTFSLSGFFAAIAGGRAEILDVVNGARSKFVAMGAVVIATSAIAGLSAGFATRMALGAPLPVAVVIGMLWALVILAVDRALMVGMANEPSLSKNLILAAPRVVLALILGTVISTPITLQIFHKETDTEIRAIQRDAADTFGQQLATDARFVVIPDLERQVADAKARARSNGGTDAAVQAKQAAYDSALATYHDLQAAAQCELNGGCGTGKPGVGDAYDEAKASADRQLEVVNAAKRDLDAAAAASTAQAQGDLSDLEPRLAALKKTRDDLQAEFDARNADDSGLLIRLEAMERLGERSTLVWWAHLLLWGMFTCIELLPVVVKLLMNMGPVSEYDRVQKNWDGSAADVFEQQSQTWKDAEHTRAQVAVDEAQHDRDLASAALRKDLEVNQDRLDREQAQQIGIQARTAQVQDKVVDAYFDVYEAQVLAQAQAQLDDFTTRHASGAATVPGAYPPPAPATNGHAVNTYIKTAALPDGTVL